MDGMETLRLIMRSAPLPVILFSTHSKEGATPRSRLSRWAPSIFSPSPRMPPPATSMKSPTSLIAKIKVAKRARRRKLPPRYRGLARAEKRPRAPRFLRAASSLSEFPPAVQTHCNLFCRQIPADFLSTIIVVQHMPEGFTDNVLRKRLDECCALEVQEARSGDLLLAGRVFNLSGKSPTSWFAAACLAVTWWLSLRRPPV